MRNQAQLLYLIFGGLFIAALVASNLIFQKFFVWDFLNSYRFELSVGILPYPITFIVTDVVSEIYGPKRANQIVISGLLAAFFSLGIIWVALNAEATSWSPVDSETFKTVFGLSPLGVAASMSAYLTAQFIDIKIFHFWKRKTKGKHLWLRNNASTFSSQIVDTATVLLLLCSFGVIEWSRFWTLFENGILFKIMIALLDTPLIYLAVYAIRRRFGLKAYQELPI